MSDIFETQRAIESKIKTLEACRQQLQARAESKSKAIAEYDKSLAVTMLKIKNGILMEIEGLKIENPQATLIEKLAKGVIWKERLEAEKTESLYKALVSTISCVQAELNGLQSISRVSSGLMNN